MCVCGGGGHIATPAGCGCLLLGAACRCHLAAVACGMATAARQPALGAAGRRDVQDVLPCMHLLALAACATRPEKAPPLAAMAANTARPNPNLLAHGSLPGAPWLC